MIRSSARLPSRMHVPWVGARRPPPSADGMPPAGRRVPPSGRLCAQPCCTVLLHNALPNSSREQSRCPTPAAHISAVEPCRRSPLLASDGSHATERGSPLRAALPLGSRLSPHSRSSISQKTSPLAAAASPLASFCTRSFCSCPRLCFRQPDAGPCGQQSPRLSGHRSAAWHPLRVEQRDCLYRYVGRMRALPAFG